jgi:hypothetical protein
MLVRKGDAQLRGWNWAKNRLDKQPTSFRHYVCIRSRHR